MGQNGKSITDAALSAKLADLDEEDQDRVEALAKLAKKKKRSEKDWRELVDGSDELLATTELEISDLAEAFGVKDVTVRKWGERHGRGPLTKEKYTPDRDTARHEFRADKNAQRTTDKAIAKETVASVEEAQRLGKWVMEAFGPLAIMYDSPLDQIITEAMTHYTVTYPRMLNAIDELAEENTQLYIILESLEPLVQESAGKQAKLNATLALSQFIMLLRASNIEVDNEMIDEALSLIIET